MMCYIQQAGSIEVLRHIFYIDPHTWKNNLSSVPTSSSMFCLICHWCYCWLRLPAGNGIKLNVIIRPVCSFLSSCSFQAFLSVSPVVLHRGACLIILMINYNQQRKSCNCCWEKPVLTPVLVTLNVLRIYYGYKITYPGCSDFYVWLNPNWD